MIEVENILKHVFRCYLSNIFMGSNIFNIQCIEKRKHDGPYRSILIFPIQ